MQSGCESRSLNRETCETLIDRYLRGATEICRIGNQISDADLLLRASPDKWSIRQILLHVCDVEIVMSYRIRAMIAEPGSRVLDFNQDRWVENLNESEAMLPVALDAFRTLRLFTGTLLRAQPVCVWANTVQHETRGEISMRWYVEHAAEHAENHLEQIERIRTVAYQAPPYRRELT